MKNYIKPNINIKDIIRLLRTIIKIEDLMSASSTIIKDNGIYDIGTTPNEEL